MNRNVRQTVLPVLAALIWGTAFAAQAMAAEHMEVLTFNFYRSVIAFLFLMGMDVVFSKITKERENMFQLSTADRKLLFLGGGACGAALFLAANLQQLGIAGTSAGKAGFLTAIYIVFVPLLGLLQGKRPTALLWGSVAIAVVGLYFLCVTESFTIVPSDIALIICAVLFALHIMIIDHFSVKVDGLQMCCIQFLVVAVLSGIGAFVLEQPTRDALMAGILPTLYVGVFSSGVAYTLQILSLKGANPTVVSLLFSLESVFAVIGGAVLLGERMANRELFGCVLMLIAVVLAQIPTQSTLSAKIG